MATIRPFMAIRPAEAYAKDVAALPYDVMNSEEAREMVQGKPWSFLHVDKAEVDLPKDIDVLQPCGLRKGKGKPRKHDSQRDSGTGFAAQPVSLPHDDERQKPDGSGLLYVCGRIY